MPLALHIPDGYLSHDVAVACAVLAAPALAWAARSARRGLDEDRVRLAGAVGALVFAAQMANFPVVDGTSGHLLGGVLAALLLGPALACVTVTVVLVVQALVFGDGGLGALGANVLDMGVLGALVAGGALAGTVRRWQPDRGTLLGLVAVAAWSAVMLAAVACSAQLAASGTAAFGAVLPAMLEVHALIGVGEAAISVAVAALVVGARPAPEPA